MRLKPDVSFGSINPHHFLCHYRYILNNITICKKREHPLLTDKISFRDLKTKP